MSGNPLVQRKAVRAVLPSRIALVAWVVLKMNSEVRASSSVSGCSSCSAARSRAACRPPNRWPGWVRDLATVRRPVSSLTTTSVKVPPMSQVIRALRVALTSAAPAAAEPSSPRCQMRTACLLLTNVGQLYRLIGIALRGRRETAGDRPSQLLLDRLCRELGAGDDAGVVKAADLGAAEAEHVGEDLRGVLPEPGRPPHRQLLETDEVQWRAGHQVAADAGMLDLLEHRVGRRA